MTSKIKIIKFSPPSLWHILFFFSRGVFSITVLWCFGNVFRIESIEKKRIACFRKRKSGGFCRREKEGVFLLQLFKQFFQIFVGDLIGVEKVFVFVYDIAVVNGVVVMQAFFFFVIVVGDGAEAFVHTFLQFRL